ncbi:GspE/PulE family protein [Bacillaceae bacterium]
MAKKRIGDLLVEFGIITEEQLQQALEEQKRSGMKLGDIFIAKGYITEQQLIEILEFQLGIPHAQLQREKIDPRAFELVSEKLARRHNVFPLRVNKNKLVVAMADPLDYYAIDELRMSTGLYIEPMIAAKDEIKRMIDRYYRAEFEETMGEVMKRLPRERDETEELADRSPIVKMVNEMIAEAVRMKASDIHIDPQENGIRVRYRIDGILRTQRELPSHMLGGITARLKVLGNLNIAESRLPQDGRFELDIDRRKVDIRISTLPTVHGEKTVLRILDLQNAIKNIEHLGFSAENLQKFKRMLSIPYGIVLITGPTGSGKTTTLYSALSRLNGEEVNIITIEDPVEYQLEGINQVQVNTAVGLTFAKGLRSVLRQDPNIIMVGEIRDVETAEIAIRAALTGHLVLSTLHTNDAVSALTRLIDMGIEPFLVASSISGIVGQRLVRRICSRCKVPVAPAPEEAELLRQHGLAAETLYKGSGCPDCNQTGYRGRMAIQEVLVPDEKMREMILARSADSEYRRHAKAQGFATMLQDGLAKAAAGETTVSEILRVII